MARVPRRKPARLAEKLLSIRYALDLSQDGMLRRLGLDEDGRARSSVSHFENGGEPELHVLLEYARSVGAQVEDLIDDDKNLPKHVQRAARKTASLRQKNRRY